MKKFTQPFLISAFMLVFSSAFSQEMTGRISGKIIDKANSEALIGATVQIEGTATGSVTDIEGQYSLSASAGKCTLVFSYISYKSEKM